MLSFQPYLSPSLATPLRSSLSRRCARRQKRAGRALPVACAERPGRRAKSAVELARDAQRVYAADKPGWCQPWTIVATGSGAIGAAWTVCRGWSSVVAVGVTGAVLLWWYAFLVVYPQGTFEGEE